MVEDSPPHKPLTMKTNHSTEPEVRFRNLSKLSTPLDCLLLTLATLAVMLSGIDGSAISEAHATEIDTLNRPTTSLQAEGTASTKVFDSPIDSAASTVSSNADTPTNMEAVPTQTDSGSSSSSELLPEDLMTVVRILMTLF